MDIQRGVISTIKELREKFPNIEIIGGNVASANGNKRPDQRRGQRSKVGVGPGSICTTRIVGSAGVPQLTLLKNARR